MRIKNGLCGVIAAAMMNACLSEFLQYIIIIIALPLSNPNFVHDFLLIYIRINSLICSGTGNDIKYTRNGHIFKQQ